jgi:hypothetical protein
MLEALGLCEISVQMVELQLMVVTLFGKGLCMRRGNASAYHLRSANWAIRITTSRGERHSKNNT